MRKSRYDTTVLSKAHEDELITELAGRIPKIRAYAMQWCIASDALRKTMKKEAKKFELYQKKWSKKK